jgi:hypothetical protein
MSGFDDREKAYEKKFAQDQQIDFTIEARTSKLFGLWAAQQLGLGESEANTYAGDVVAANLEEAGFEDIIRKVRKDFDAKGISVSDHVINAQLEKALDEAKKQLKG